MNVEFSFDYFSITLLMGGITALLSGFVVFIHNRKKLENISWLLSNLTSAIWSFGYFAMINSVTKDTAIWSNIILHIASIYIPTCYFLVVISITGTYEKYKKQILIFSLIGFVFVLLTPTKWFVQDVISKANFNFVCDAGPLYIYYTIFFFTVVLYALYVLIKKVKSESNVTNKQRYKYMILFTIFGFGGGGSVFFLTFNIPILPYPLILFSLYPAISAYAVFRYQLFNVKVITTELLVFILWLFLIFRTMLETDNMRDLINNVSILLLSIVVGILIIRSVTKEIKLREKIEKLALDLERANVKLKELDQLKSEFLSLATHQIRAPLTAIKGYTSMILEGDYGVVPQKAKDAVEIIMKSCQNLIKIVEDFLNISRIEQGRMVYDKEDFDVVDLVEEIVKELRPNAANAGLTLNLDVAEYLQSKVNADKNKIKQVIGNIIDNAIKYTPEGHIEISIFSDANTVKVAVKDSGVGLGPEDMNKLFRKFSRAKSANKNNVHSTGLGLYLAKKIIEAHHGDIKVDSLGKDKGTTFTVELPLER